MSTEKPEFAPETETSPGVAEAEANLKTVMAAAERSLNLFSLREMSNADLLNRLRLVRDHFDKINAIIDTFGFVMFLPAFVGAFAASHNYSTQDWTLDQAQGIAASGMAVSGAMAALYAVAKVIVALNKIGVERQVSKHHEATK